MAPVSDDEDDNPCYDNARDVSIDIPENTTDAVLTWNPKICIDMRNDSEYFYEEHFFDIDPMEWATLCEELPIELYHVRLSRETTCNAKQRYNKVYFHYLGALPVRVRAIVSILTRARMKALYDHTFVERVHVVKKKQGWDMVEVWCGS